jgi:hypothetical protein
LESLDRNKDQVMDRAEWLVLEKYTIEEVKRLNETHHSSTDLGQITEMFDEFDTDHDARITFQELTRGYCIGPNPRNMPPTQPPLGTNIQE